MEEKAREFEASLGYSFIIKENRLAGSRWHAYNPSYSGGRDQEYQSLKTSPGK
jgi:hypothetical protein